MERSAQFTARLVVFVLALFSFPAFAGMEETLSNRDLLSGWTSRDWENALNWYDIEIEACNGSEKATHYDPSLKEITLGFGCAFPFQLAQWAGNNTVLNIQPMDVGQNHLFFLTIRHDHTSLNIFTLLYGVDGEDRHGVMMIGPQNGTIVPTAFGADGESVYLMIERRAPQNGSDLVLENYKLQGLVLAKLKE